MLDALNAYDALLDGEGEEGERSRYKVAQAVTVRVVHAS